MESIKYSFKTLGDLATKIKLHQEVHSESMKNKDILNQIHLSTFYQNKNLSFQNIISSSSLNWIIIDTISFIDEYEKKLTAYNYPNYSDKILLLKKINNPALRRIKKWTDLKKYRNTILVHNLTIKNKHIYSFQNPIKYNYPKNNDEVKLLSDLILIISKNIGFVFNKLVNEIDFSTSIANLILTNKNEINFKLEIKNVVNEIEAIKKSISNDN